MVWGCQWQHTVALSHCLHLLLQYVEISVWFLVHLRIKEQRSAKTRSEYMYPFHPQYPHTNSPDWCPYTSLNNTLREFGRRSKHFLLGDHIINSHNHFSWQHMDIVRGKLMLVTPTCNPDTSTYTWTVKWVHESFLGYHQAKRACLNGGGGPQVTRSGGVTRQSIYFLILIWSRLRDR